MDVISQKLAKERFVSGHSGTSLGEIYLLTVTLISGYLLRCVLVVCVPRLQQANTALSFLVEYTTIILPGILVFTILSDYTAYVLLFTVSISCVISIHSLLKSKVIMSTMLKSLSEIPYSKRLPCVTLSRTFITLITAIAILAVDFTVYPRRLAKAETYGTGLMDIGVGVFLMAHGLTSPEAREKNIKIGFRGYIKMVLLTMRHVLPLFVIGVLRLLAVKSTDYQEHVTEYGVHWNFFFTIAVVRVSYTVTPTIIDVLADSGLVAEGLEHLT